MRNLLIAAIVISIIGVGGYFLLKSKAPSPSQTPSQVSIKKEEGKKVEGYSGSILAGTSSPLLDFNKSDYDKALGSNKLIVLYFYANWCPICKEEVPHLYEAFNELKSDQIIGFRVNYNDSDTDKDEVELARQFGVAYQHTKVFIRNRQQILKAPDTWDKSRYLSEIGKFVSL